MQSSSFRVRAQMATLGGAILLAVCITVTLVLLFSLVIPRMNGSQQLIVVLLSVGTWMYFLNSVSERIALEDEVLEVRSLLGRTHRFSLSEIQSIRVMERGLRLDGAPFLIEIQTVNRSKPREIALGPCWKEGQLKEFSDVLTQELQKIID